MKFESFLEVAGELPQLYDGDVAVSVCDREKVLAFYPSPKLKLNVKVGSSNINGGVSDEAMRTGKRILRRVPREVLGIPYIGIGHPIYENGVVVGCVIILISVDKYEILINTGKEILAAIEETCTTAENLSASSEELAATVKDMEMETSLVLREVEHTNKVKDKINHLSMRTNILGLNASIEAARAGELGKGFSVVAEEVRKLSETTKVSTQEIESDLKVVQASVNTLIESISQLSEVTDSQANAATELSAAMAAITKLAERLVKLGALE
ncbi:methyl-accepting chemotaxis protein [Desulfosporosinus lacus]|uniref:Methyl-accepting chemotaxis protein (MCP) signalling domain-containing protein n=1 Tax=Desulfosporosinus lacus DSM 15449 TaxID=1121420 RepID=A0A1M5XPX9_9FIRM|nr:methyl-accepting chemotaxis protein [Desulfosporosinus lacus]SHI01809.1 Methyl-accepting chemotaxis protein (MCP) signalling domain-containing protein [Desulfosporosinus lacus DSM 15449]